MSAGTYTEFYVGTGGARTNAGDGKTNVQTAQNCTYLQGGGAGGADLFTAPSGTPFAASVAGDWIAIYTNAASQFTFLGRILVVNSSTSVDISLTSFAGNRPTNLSTWQASVGGVWPKPTVGTTFPLNLTGTNSIAAATNSNGDMPRINYQCVGNAGIDSAMTSGITCSQTGPFVLAGYNATPGDGASHATDPNYKFRIDGSTSNITLMTVSGAQIRIEDFVFSNNATGNVDGLVISGARCTVSRCVAHDIRRAGFSMTAGSGFVNFIECEAYTCNIASVANNGGFVISASSVTIYERCISHDNTLYGFVTSGTHGTVNYLDCVADTNTSHGFFVQPSVNLAIRFKQSVAYNNGGDGIRISASAGGGSIHIESCNFELNGTSGTGYGVNRTDSQNNMGFVYNCVFNTDATIGNKTGSYNGLTNFWDVDVATFNPIITTTAEQFNAPSTGDFRTTGTDSKGAGRGSYCQTQASYSGTVGYPDVGVQHLDASFIAPAATIVKSGSSY